VYFKPTSSKQQGEIYSARSVDGGVCSQTPSFPLTQRKDEGDSRSSSFFVFPFGLIGGTWEDIKKGIIKKLMVTYLLFVPTVHPPLLNLFFGTYYLEMRLSQDIFKPRAQKWLRNHAQRFVSINGNQIRPGNVIEKDGRAFKVVLIASIFMGC
jgi:hypothetical protein